MDSVTAPDDVILTPGDHHVTRQTAQDIELQILRPESDTAAAYDGSGTSDPGQEYTGGRGGH